MAFLSRFSTIEKGKIKKVRFFDILKISDLYIFVDPPGKIPSGGSTIFSLKNPIFEKVNLLNMNIFF
jgi:hypothetical protein